MSKGLDYFPVDTNFDDSIKLIEAEFGMTGFGIVIKVWQRIYGSRGYYTEWSADNELLLANEIKADVHTVHSVIEKCLDRRLFCRELYESHGILTSAEIQKKFMLACRRRREIELTEEYLLIEPEPSEERQTIKIISVTHGLPTVNPNEQRKKETKETKESKVNNNKEKENCGVVACGESGVYKEVFGEDNPAAEAQLKKYADVMDRALIVHILQLASIDKKPWRWVIKVLDTHYAQETRTVEQFNERSDSFGRQNVSRTPVNKFCDYEQEGSYDIEALERRAMERQKRLFLQNENNAAVAR